jgi:probable rRNA maturation factor
VPDPTFSFAASPLSEEGSADDDEPPEPEPGAAEPLRLELSLELPDADPPLTGWLEPQFGRTLTFAGVAQAGLSLAVVDDARMAQLHKQYCDEPETADVLTFDMREAPGQQVEGEIVLCLDQARRQSERRGHPARLEVLLYAVHGLLHLLGYDDHDPAAAAAMHAREDELLTAAGFGPVYGHSGDAGPGH